MEENAYSSFFAKDYGLNVDVPKEMNDFDFKDYTYHLNRGMTQNERINYYKRPIPYDEGVKIAQRSKDKPEEPTFKDNVTDTLKSMGNLLVDLPTSTSAFIDDVVTGMVNEMLYKDPKQAAQATLMNLQERENLKDKLKAETKGTFWGQGLGSVGASTALGVVSKASPLVLGMFGTLNYEQNLRQMLEQGATFSEANRRATLGGVGEVASEKAGFKVASKYIDSLWKKYFYRFGVESFQEWFQEKKDQAVLGKYDTRTEEEKRKAEMSSALFGGLGGALGFAISDVSTRKARANISEIAKEKGFTEKEAKDIGLSVLDEQGEKFRLDTLKIRNERINKELDKARGNVYDRLVEQGNDPKVAAEKAETLVPKYETIESEVEEIVEQGFKEAELDKLKKDYEEAIRLGGERAGVYLQIKDRVNELAKEAGFTEEESESQQKILTSLFAQWYDKTDMSVDDFWNFLETRLELKDVINEPVVGENIDKELARREQLETAMNVGKKGGRLFSRVFANGKEVEAFDDIKTADGRPVNYSNEGNYYDTGINRAARLGREETAIVRMSPQQFLELTPKGMGSRDVSNIENVINEGGEIPMPFLEVEILDKDNKILKVFGHEGRHRSLAMSNLGVNDGYVILTGRDLYRNKELLKDLSEWKILGQKETDVNKAVPLSENMFPRSEDSLFSRTDRIQGAFDRVNDIVEIAKEHNPDVFLHEMSHVFFTNYMPWLEESGRGKEAEAIYKLVGKNNLNEFADEDWEKITETFLQYVKTGEAPSLATKNVFKKAKDWIITQFRTISEDYEISKEVRDFFDNLIADESDISQLANVKTRIRDIENSLKQHLNNQQVTFKGQSAEDIKALRRAFHTRITRKGESLTDHLRKAGGIEPDSELAKQLGYDPKNKKPIFKKGGIDSMDSLREFLFDEGYLNRNEYDTYEQLSEIENEVENLIENSDLVYNEDNRILNENRENTLNLQSEVAGVYDDIMKDLGIKSYDELETVLAEVEKDIKTQNKDIARVNKSAIKYIETSMKKARRDIQKTEKDVAKLKEKYSTKLDNLKQKQRDANETQYVLQQELIDKIRGLPINYAHQNALMKNIARVKDLNSYNRVVEDVMESAEKYADSEMKWLLRNSIDSMLKGTKQKGGENKLYTYEGGKLFAELRGIKNMTQNEAQNMLDDRLEQAYKQNSNGVDESVQWTEADKMLNRMLKYKAEGMKASTSDLYDLALDLDMMIRDNIRERREFDELKTQQRNQMRTRMMDSLKTRKKGTKAERFFTQYLGDWHTVNNEAFGKEIADELNLLYEASNQDEYYNVRKKYADESALSSYGLKNEFEWLDKQEELREQKYFIQRNDTDVPVKMSTFDLMDLFLQMQNPETRELIIRNYETVSEDGVILTQQVNNLLDNLTDQDKAFALSLARRLQEDYDVENEAYKKRTGVDMPHLEGYFPRTALYGDDVDTDYKNVALARPSFYKMRSGNAIPVFRDAYQKYNEHIMEASYAVEMFDRYKEIYLTVMNSPDLQTLYKQKYGEDGWKEYKKQLFSLGAGQYSNTISKAEKLAGKLVNNWIAKNIGFNPSVYVKQLFSIINYSENMPVGEFMKNLGYGITHPKEAKALVEKIAGGVIRSRYERGLQNETVASILKGREKGKTELFIPPSADARFKTASSYLVRKGDITPIIFGGYARIKYLQEQGMSDEEIKKIFVEETNRSQQSSLSPALSTTQKNQNGFLRWFLAYKNTPLQYTRLTMEAVTQYKRGEISAKKLAKTLVTYAVLQRLMYELSSSLIKGVAGFILGDDKKKKEATPSVAQIVSSPIRFFTDAIPIVDTTVNRIVDRASGRGTYSSGFGLSDDMAKAIDKSWKYFNKGGDINDLVDSGLLISDLMTGLGLSTIKRQAGYFIPEKKNKL